MRKQSKMRAIEILLVEDNEGDILLTTEALEECTVANHLNVVRNGKEALNYLYKVGRYSDSILPDLILLDINLPLKSGHEVLSVIKADKGLMHIPVIMLTTSSSEADISKSYNQGANCYIVKPLNAEEFTTVVSSIDNFWFSTCAFPIMKPE